MQEEGDATNALEVDQSLVSVYCREISNGEMRKSQETYILYDAIDVTRLKKGAAAECKNTWLEGTETGCQGGNCLIQRGGDDESPFIHDSIRKLFMPWCMYAYSQPP